MTLVDTNILIDLATHDPVWSKKSRRAFEHRAAIGPVLIVDVIFAELASGFQTDVDCSDFLAALKIEHSTMSRRALWLAGQAFRDYRRRGGAKTNVLADFFIGAQASASGMTVLTRDAGRYRTYFPQVAVVEPE